MSEIEPQRGMRFIHSQWMNEDYLTPLVCEITQMNEQVIYYRPIYMNGKIGAACYAYRNSFPRYVKEWVTK